MSKISPAITPAVDATELAAIVASLEKKVAKLEGKSGDEEGSEAPPESPYSFAFGALLNPQSGIAAQIWSCTLLYVMLFFQVTSKLKPPRSWRSGELRRRCRVW